MFTTIGMGWLVSLLKGSMLLTGIIGTNDRIKSMKFLGPNGEVIAEITPADVAKIELHCG